MAVPASRALSTDDQRHERRDVFDLVVCKWLITVTSDILGRAPYFSTQFRGRFRRRCGARHRKPVIILAGCVFDMAVQRDVREASGAHERQLTLISTLVFQAPVNTQNSYKHRKLGKKCLFCRHDLRTTELGKRPLPCSFSAHCRCGCGGTPPDLQSRHPSVSHRANTP